MQNYIKKQYHEKFFIGALGGNLVKVQAGEWECGNARGMFIVLPEEPYS